MVLSHKMANIVCIKVHGTDQSDSSYFPRFGSLRSVRFNSGVYTNNRCHGLCWQLLLSCELFQSFCYSRSLDIDTHLAMRFRTLSFSSWQHLGVPNLTTLLQNQTHQSKKVREKSRECHNNKPQPFPDTKRKRKQRKPNKRKSNKRTKSTKISSFFPKRGNRNAQRTEKHKNKITQDKT